MISDIKLKYVRPPLRYDFRNNNRMFTCNLSHSFEITFALKSRRKSVISINLSVSSLW